MRMTVADKMKMMDEIYGLHCDIGRLENEKEHWHTEFINEREYAHMMEERAEKAEVENVALRELVRDIWCKARLLDANKDIEGMRVSDEIGKELMQRIVKLGIGVD